MPGGFVSVVAMYALDALVSRPHGNEAGVRGRRQGKCTEQQGED
jgi:hypothetical protein